MWKTVKHEQPNVGQRVLICYIAFGISTYSEATYIEYDAECYKGYFQTDQGVKVASHWNPEIPQIE